MEFKSLDKTNYCKHTKFRGINFRALAGYEFHGPIFSCGIHFCGHKVLDMQNQLPAM